MSDYVLSPFVTNILFENSLSLLQNDSNNIYIVDRKVYDIYPNYFKKLRYLFDATEKNKTLSEVKKIYTFFSKNSVHRNTNIIGVGGGVTTDIAAFAASTYKRGCKLTLIPTTLLAMCDASIGGKTGVNFANQKNMIGSFYPAEKVYVFSEFLKSLPKSELLNGRAEIIKASLISQNPISSLLKKGFDFASKEVIEEAIKVKMNLCVQDPFDKSVRRFLNFGHTFAHIIESLSNYEIPHGKAVAMGIYTASLLSYKMRFLTYEKLALIKEMLSDFDFPQLKNLDKIDKKMILADKKNDSKINLVLLKDIGKPFIFQPDKWHLVKDILIEIQKK